MSALIIAAASFQTAAYQKTKVLLKGQGDDKGSSLLLSFVGSGMNIDTMRRVVGGQHFRYPRLKLGKRELPTKS